VIRELRDSDVPALAGLVRPLLPSMVISERGLEHMRASTTWWVAEQAGTIVGTARAGRFGRMWVGVAPGARGHGIGSALLERAETAVRDAGWDEAVAWSDGDEGERFAARHGYETEREKPLSVLRLDESPLPPLPDVDGVALVPLVELGDRLRELWELTMAAYADEPGESRPAEQPFESWLRDDIGIPDLELAGSTVAVADERLVALSLLTSDGAERAENDFTGSHPDYRGRRLATLVKLAALHWAQAQGIREVWTGNDADNAPMLAINRRLGYRVAGARRKHVKRV
jgi:GNAT superfamily N-acetyltransferase